MARMCGKGLGVAELDYRLPGELIAQEPSAGRDASRLLVVDRTAGTVRDGSFVDLPGLLSAGDLLVLNDTKVVPAKLMLRRATGGGVDGLFVRDCGGGEWEVLLRGGRRLKVGERLLLEASPGREGSRRSSGATLHSSPQGETLQSKEGDELELLSRQGGGRWRARLVSDSDTDTVLGRVGRTPLPPYIHRGDAGRMSDRERYQTIFARRSGAVAAPTAALHFTERVFGELETRGVQRGFVTLHVGPGTFQPINVESVDEHRMHAEWYDMPAKTVKKIAACRERGGGVVAAGTTAVRVLETWAADGEAGSASGWTDVFIRPGYRFGVVDRLLTNFHLPRSTLLALVMAFAGVELIRAAYAHAIDQRYRFYSYGDAMLIL